MTELYEALPTRARAARVRERLTSWYRAHKRDLPWRHTSDGYAIWISEAMLQQTRVEAVIDHYVRFLKRFPTVADLADASEDDVLAAWSGLGYYRRARSLRAAAQEIVRVHDGHFPREARAALALPGVGRYTAGAVLSIAYDLPRPLVDGNVERVFARLFDLDAAAGSKELQDACWALAERMLPLGAGAGEWNQALMELGATTCTARAPACSACPLSRSCRARRAGHAEVRPRPKARPQTVAVELELAFARDRGRWLLERRPAGGRMARMWQLPTIERPTTTGLFPASWPAGVELRTGGALLELRHTITRHRIRAVVYAADVLQEPAGGACAWHAPADFDGLGLTGMTRKVIRQLERAVGPGRSVHSARSERSSPSRPQPTSPNR